MHDRFRNKEPAKEFFVFNVHNDYKSRDNRLRTSKLIREKMASIVPAGMPTIVLGDLNAPCGFEELGMLGEYGLTLLPPAGATNRLFGLHLLPAIDHILVGGGIRAVSDIKLWRSRYDGVYPSDHYPISVTVAY